MPLIVTTDGTYSWTYSLMQRVDGLHTQDTSQILPSTVVVGGYETTDDLQAVWQPGDLTSYTFYSTALADTTISTNDNYATVYTYDSIVDTGVNGATGGGGTVKYYFIVVRARTATGDGQFPPHSLIQQRLYYILIKYSGILTAGPAPEADGSGNPIPDITLQIARSSANIYTCQTTDNAILPKYSSAYGGQFLIRGNYASGTKVGVIRSAINNGFMIYQEVASNPSGIAYVYSKDRRLVTTIDASGIAQYLP